jgi:hypothetical protein
MKIKIDSGVLKEFEYMVELHKEYGAALEMDSVECLVNYVLMSIADGSRRPGSWERQMLCSMGLIAECQAHEVYRNQYGKPE